MDNFFDITSAQGMKVPFTGEDTDFLEIRKNIIRESLADVYDRSSNFETVTSVKGVEFVNDSFALTPDRTGSSLLRCFKPVTLILAEPENSYELSELAEIVEEKVNTIICLGQNVKTRQHHIEPLIYAPIQWQTPFWWALVHRCSILVHHDRWLQQK